MFAYCNNNPVALEDISGMASKSCLYDSTEPRMPWRDSGSGGGRPVANYSSYDYGVSISDKFYTTLLLKYIFNKDAQVVLNAEHVAFYNGVLVIKSDNPWGSFSFGVILLNTGVKNDAAGRNTLNHEYGHYLHLRDIGVVKYACKVVLPSLIGATLSQLDMLDAYYYDLPWEHIADKYGGVSRAGYASWASDMAAIYWLFSNI